MKTLNDLKAYARTKEMSKTDIERLISVVETDGNGNVLDCDAFVFGIDCKISNHDWCNNKPITFKAKYIANTTKELDGKYFNGTEMRFKTITHFVKKDATIKEVFNRITDVALLYEGCNESLIGVEVVIE